tara:strand:+ start:2059 stop:3966 length:1908 start_codon:yes stop_codon:yes gene_type:complete
MTPYKTIAVIDLNGEMFYASLGETVSIYDRSLNEQRTFLSGIVSCSLPSGTIQIENMDNGSYPSASIEISNNLLDMWKITRERQQAQTGIVSIYCVRENDKFLDQCLRIFKGVIGPVTYKQTKGSWRASIRAQRQNVDTVFPPNSAGEVERYGIIDWPAISVRGIYETRGEAAYPGGITRVANNALQNASSAVPVVYGTVYGASVPVLQARLITWHHDEDDPTVYSALTFDVGIACHPIVGSPQYQTPSVTAQLIPGLHVLPGSAFPDTFVDIYQDGYLIPNEGTNGIPSDLDGNGYNRRRPSPVYYRRDKKGGFTAVANLRPPPFEQPIPTPDWVDLDLIEGLPTPHPNEPDPDDPGHFDNFQPLMPEIDTGAWNIPILVGKPHPSGTPMDGLGDMLLDIWREYARQGYGDLDQARIAKALPVLNKYKVGVLFNEQPKASTVTRMIASRISSQFPVTLGAQTGVWGFDCLEFPSKEDDLLFEFRRGINLDQVLSIKETDLSKVRNRFHIKYRYDGWKGETVKELFLDKENSSLCRTSAHRWGESPQYLIEAPDISDSGTAALIANEWARRLCSVRMRYQYVTYDTSVISLPLASHVTLTDESLGIHNESMCYEGCSLDASKGTVTIQLLSIDEV